MYFTTFLYMKKNKTTISISFGNSQQNSKLNPNDLTLNVAWEKADHV